MTLGGSNGNTAQAGFPRQRTRPERPPRTNRGGCAVTIVNDAARAGTGRTPGDDSSESVFARLGLRFTNWAEHWFPDAYVFVALAVAVVAAAAMLNGATPVAGGGSFSEGFCRLITLTLQMAMAVLCGYAVPKSPPAAQI